MVVVAPALTPLTVIVPSAAPLHETLVLAALTVTATAGCVRATIWQLASTNRVFEAAIVPHEPPLVVRVNVAVPVKVEGGVQVAFTVVASGLKVPPGTLDDHVPPVAVPPTEPPNGADTPPLHISARAAPALATGAWIITV